MAKVFNIGMGQGSGKIKTIVIPYPILAGSLTYTGSSQSPTWSGYDPDMMEIAGTTTATNAGTYTAVFTPIGVYVWEDGTQSPYEIAWTIGRATISVTPTQSGTLTYTGSSLSPSWSNYDSAQLTIGGTTSGTNAGSYTATFTPTSNYQWSDGSTSAVSVAWTIGRATISVTPTQSGTLTYTGSSLSPSWSNYDSAQLTIGGTTSGTNAGSYTATFTPTSNYQWSDGSTSSVSVTWTIGRATISTTPSQSGTLTYTGSSQSPSWSNYSSSQLTLGGTTSGTNAGSYTATFTPTSNYQWSDGTTSAKSVTWTIGRATISATPSQSGSLTYTGSSQSPSWSNYNSSQLTLSGTTSGTNAGSYTATFTPTSNYQWSDGTTSAKSVTWTIGRATPTLSLSSTSLSTSMGSTATITVTYNGDGSISVSSSNTNRATVSYSSSNKRVTVTGGSISGSATITVSASSGTNYNSASVTCSVTNTGIGALDDCSWATISSYSSTGANYWSVGDTKKIHVEGTVGTLSINQDFYVFILGFDHNSSLEGTGITFGCFKTADNNMRDVCLVSNYNTQSTSGSLAYFNINHWGNYDYGGWQGCDLRYDILGSTDTAPSGYGSTTTTSRTGYNASGTCATNPVKNTLMAALPEDLRAIMKPMTVYTDGVGNYSDSSGNVVATIDYLPLLAEFEVFGIQSFANRYERNSQAQYSYYALGNNKVKYRHSSTGSTAIWWCRSADSSTNTTFCTVYTSGSADSNSVGTSYGLAPIFRV